MNRGLIIFLLTLVLELFGSTVTANAQTIVEYINAGDEVYESNPDSSFQLCCIAEELQESQNDFSQAGAIAMCKGRYYLLKTEYGNATEELNKAIIFYEEKNDLRSLSEIYSLKSILFDRLGDNEKAHVFLLKSYQTTVNIGDKAGQIHHLLNLPLDYFETNELDSAHFFLSKLNEFKEELSDHSLYYYYQNWGTYFKLSQNYQKAIAFEEKALQIAELYDMLDSKATIKKELATTYLGNGEIEKAKEHAKISYDISKQHDLIYEKSEALEVLVNISELEQNFKDAFKYNKELTAVQKKILNIEKLSQTTEMENKLAVAQKELEGKLAVAEKEKIIAEKDLETAEVKSHNLILYFIVGIAIILIIITTWIYIKTRKLNIEIQVQKRTIEEKNDYLNEAYKNINDSIHYSKHIQSAMLPNDDLFEKNTSDHFILYKPKDIVSGDFYWAQESNEKLYFSVVDCTGHGVPGAMVSIIGFNGLNRCINELKLNETGKILDHLSDFVEETLSTDKSNIKDGMDMAICAIEKQADNSASIDFSGANNGIYVISDRELTEYKPNKQPIGHYESKIAFDTHQISLKKGDSVYLFSDGYADQFGGPKGKKMKYKTFKEELKKSAHLKMKDQKNHLETFFENWMGDHEQIDDVCIIGIKI